MVTHYNKLLIVSILLGLSKGLRQVYMTRVLAERVTQDQLSSVGVLQIVFNLVGFVVIGPILGKNLNTVILPLKKCLFFPCQVPSATSLPTTAGAWYF